VAIAAPDGSSLPYGVSGVVRVAYQYVSLAGLVFDASHDFSVTVAEKDSVQQISLPHSLTGLVMIRLTGTSAFDYTTDGEWVAGLQWAGFSRPIRRHFTNQEIVNSTVPFDSTRISACAVLCTNVTKVLNKEGTVLATRLLNDINEGVFPWKYDEQDMNKTHPTDRFYGALEKGVYTFTAPDQESTSFRRAYKNKDLVTYDAAGQKVKDVSYANEPSYCYYVTPAYFNALLLTDEDVATISTVAVTVDVHYEFRTTSTLFSLNVSEMSLEDYHMAMLTLNRIGYHYENETHWLRTVAKIAKAAVSTAAKVAPVLPLRPAVKAAVLVGQKLLATAPKQQQLAPQQATLGKNKKNKKKRKKKN
jgi:hypothetical protein